VIDTVKAKFGITLEQEPELLPWMVGTQDAPYLKN
jgi:hypothetical protein